MDSVAKMALHILQTSYRDVLTVVGSGWPRPPLR